jgi:hypothetical protein
VRVLRSTAVTVMALGVLMGASSVFVVPAEAKAGEISAAEVERVDAFYQSKQGLAVGGVTAPTGAAAKASKAGDDYYLQFASSYADDPDVEVRGLDITAEVLGKVVTGDKTQYRVSVTVDYQLYDTYNKRPFTGGETVDHLLSGPTPTKMTTASAAANSFTSDVALAVSTAPVRDAADEADDSTGSDSAPAYHVPAWQLDRKKSLSRTGKMTTAASSSYPGLNYSVMATYAYYWTEPKRANSINALNYGASAGNDCTNFISQALHRGGWPIRDTTRKHRANLDYWDYNMTGPGRFTYSWSRAEESYRRVHDKAGKKTFSKLEDAWLADLVYADWNVGDAKYGDGNKDHVMIVSTVTRTRPYFSQKSGNRHNVSAAEVVRNTKAGGGTKWKWYGLRT